MGWATWDKEINGQHAGDTSGDLRMSGEDAPRNCARANRDNDLGIRNGVVGFSERLFHVSRHRAGDQYSVGMPRRGDELYPESAEVVYECAEDVSVCFAGVAAAGADLPESKGTSKEPAQLSPTLVLVRRVPRSIHFETRPMVTRHAVFARELQRLFRTRQRTFTAEDAFPQVEGGLAGRSLNGIDRTRVDASGAFRRAFCGVYSGQAAELFG